MKFKTLPVESPQKVSAQSVKKWLSYDLRNFVGNPVYPQLSFAIPIDTPTLKSHHKHIVIFLIINTGAPWW